MQAVAGEQMGRDTVPDLLGIGFSANDRVGHLYGPESHEVMDVMLRLDRTLARLFADLDRSVGLANVLVVLTGDHGVAPMPEARTGGEAGRGARRLDPAVVDSAASRALTARYGPPPPPGWIAYDGQPLLYLNRAALSARHATLEEAERVAQAGIRGVPGVHDALTGVELSRLRAAGRGGDVARSFYPERGSDLYWYLEPYWLPTRDRFGTDHGSPWRYDQDVPLLWLGAGIRPGVYQEPATVADIAPTLSALLGLPPPAGAQGRVLREALR
jgi:arylsulfatase A-like enzyme